MRLLLTLKQVNNENIPANYFYPLSAAIYKLLKFGSPEFSSFLHDIGYPLNGKRYKLFTFALRFKQFKFQNGGIKLYTPEADLLISSPLIEDFIQTFIYGTFETQKLSIASKRSKADFQIHGVESLAKPDIKTEMSFKLLSPILFSTKKIFNGKLQPYYYRYYDDIEKINKVLNENLKNKYTVLHNESAGEKCVRLEWDKNYLERAAQKGKRPTVKQTIKEGEIDSTEIVGNMVPFTISR